MFADAVRRSQNEDQQHHGSQVALLVQVGSEQLQQVEDSGYLKVRVKGTRTFKCSGYSSAEAVFDHGGQIQQHNAEQQSIALISCSDPRL